MPVTLFQLRLMQPSHFWSPTVRTIIPICQIQAQQESRFSKQGYVSGSFEGGAERQRKRCYRGKALLVLSSGTPLSSPAAPAQLPAAVALPGGCIRRHKAAKLKSNRTNPQATRLP